MWNLYLVTLLTAVAAWPITPIVLCSLYQLIILPFFAQWVSLNFERVLYESSNTIFQWYFEETIIKGSHWNQKTILWKRCETDEIKKWSFIKDVTPLCIFICCYATTGDHFRWCVKRRSNKILEKTFSNLWNFIKITVCIFWKSKETGKHEFDLCNLSRKIHIKLWRFINSMRTFIS